MVSTTRAEIHNLSMLWPPYPPITWMKLTNVRNSTPQLNLNEQPEKWSDLMKNQPQSLHALYDQVRMRSQSSNVKMRNASFYKPMPRVTLVEGLKLSITHKKMWISLSTGLRGSICFPASGFTSYWTLSSKFFATFPHGTCLLSVSQLYLALGGAYHLI
jgi:hypothetical protein